jgi:hypothetical protein
VLAIQDGQVVVIEAEMLFHNRFSPLLPAGYQFNPLDSTFIYHEQVEPEPEPVALGKPPDVVMRIGSGPTEVSLPGAVLRRGK